MINFIETFGDALTTKDCNYIIDWMNQDNICLPDKKEHKGEILKDYSGIAIDALDLLSNKFPEQITKNQEDDCLNVNNIITSNNVDLIMTENSVKIYKNVKFQNKNVKSSADRIKYDIVSGNVVIDMFEDINKVKITKINGSN